jgi:hypothetical protein
MRKRIKDGQHAVYFRRQESATLKGLQFLIKALNGKKEYDF